MHARLGSRPFHSPVSPVHRPSPSHGYASPQAAIRRASDLCSIFVGNLPADVDEAALREVFRAHGHIHQIEIIRKPTVNGKVPVAFQFSN
jgi:RNA recognition motif-containing protein